MKINEISDLIRTVASAEINPRFRNLREDEVVYKEPDEFVTAADLAVEFALIDGLRKLYPQAVVTGEEDVSKNPMRLVELLDADSGFLMDPIDGTNNFIKGNERFAVMVAALVHGKVIASWIYLPVHDIMAVAEKGAGAFFNGERMRVEPAPINLSDLIGAAHTNRMPEKDRIVVRENLKLIKINKPSFCAGYDYVALTKSETHFSSYHRTLLWDHLPGTFLYSKAGGYVRGLDGKPYTSRSDGNGLLSAPDKDTWQLLRKAIYL